MMHLGHTMFRDPKVNKTDSDRKNTWKFRLNSCSFRLKKSSARGCRYRLSNTLLHMKLFQQRFIRFGFESQLKDGRNSGRMKWVLEGSRRGGVAQRAWGGRSGWRHLIPGVRPVDVSCHLAHTTQALQSNHFRVWRHLSSLLNRFWKFVS